MKRKTPWRCYARPAHGGGSECGHMNDNPDTFIVFGDRELECCEGCGCTRVASDHRRDAIERKGGTYKHAKKPKEISP